MPRALTILTVAYPLATVSLDSIGGAEQIAALLDAGLTSAGHNSIVIASEGSRVAGTLLATPRWDGSLDDDVQSEAAAAHASAISQALARWNVDVVHLHGVDFHQYLPPAGATTLVTLHLPISWYPLSLFDSGRGDLFFNCVSASQQTYCPPCARLVPHIANGVALEKFAARHARRDFALALGRICPE